MGSGVPTLSRMNKGDGTRVEGPRDGLPCLPWHHAHCALQATEVHVSRCQDLRHLHRLHPVCARLPPGCAGDGALGWLQGGPDRFLSPHGGLHRLQALRNRLPTDFISIRVYLGDETSRSMGLSY